jgi:hypothetical protein
MLSVIVLCHSARISERAGVSPEAVVRTLSALVTASVQGLVRDVVLAGPERKDLALIADHAGCISVAASSETECLRQAFECARAETLLILLPGYVPEQGFIEEVEKILLEAEPPVGRFIRAAPMTYFQRLAPMLTPIAGLLAPLRACRALRDDPGLSFESLLRVGRRGGALRSRARRVAL